MTQWLVLPVGCSEVHEFASDSDIATSAVRKILEGEEWVELYDDETQKILMRWEVSEHHADGTVSVKSERF